MLQSNERARGVFTAALLAERDPERFQQARELLAEGSLSQRQIARSLSMSRNSIAQIYRMMVQAGGIEPARKQLAAHNVAIARLSNERLEEILSDDGADVSAKDLSIIAAVATDKAQLLSGGPTAIIEHIDAPSADDLARLAEALDSIPMHSGRDGIFKKAEPTTGTEQATTTANQAEQADRPTTTRGDA
jgi:transcriptional regulator with XRE-family HTH domain